MSKVNLFSAVGIDYTALREFLAAKDWLKADDETARLILKIAGKDNDFLYDKDIERLPCVDIQTIDQLWMYYSDKHFGYSMQSHLWEGIQIKWQGKAGFIAFRDFASLLGWFTKEGWFNSRKNINLKDVPKGHFPRWGFDIHGMIPYTYEVVWMPGWLGLDQLNEQKRMFGGGYISLIKLMKESYSDKLSPLNAFFSRIQMCRLTKKTADFIAAIEQDQEIQEKNSQTVTPEINQLEIQREELNNQNYYITTDIEVAQQQIIKSIAQRQGQPKFRKDLLEAYNYCCAITGCDAEEALEAAHIIPYCKTEDNNISNGLLLRADVHTLFDLNLIAINPESMTVHIAPNLRHTNYFSEIEGKTLQLPTYEFFQPRQEALKWRCDQCVWYTYL